MYRGLSTKHTIFTTHEAVEPSVTRPVPEEGFKGSSHLQKWLHEIDNMMPFVPEAEESSVAEESDCSLSLSDLSSKRSISSDTQGIQKGTNLKARFVKKAKSLAIEKVMTQLHAGGCEQERERDATKSINQIEPLQQRPQTTANPKLPKDFKMVKHLARIETPTNSLDSDQELNVIVADGRCSVSRNADISENLLDTVELPTNNYSLSEEIGNTFVKRETPKCTATYAKQEPSSKL